MRSVSVRLCDLHKAVIPLGFVGENEHTRVRFDCMKLFGEYPEAVQSLTVQPPMGVAYPAVTVRDGDYVIWDVTDSDLAEDGNGEIQLTFTVDGVVAKSYIAKTKISRSLEPAGDVPEPIDDWITRANTALNAIPQEIEDSMDATMGEITAEAETLAPGSSATAEFDAESKKFSFGIPAGERGEKGERGETGSLGRDGVDGKDGKDGLDGQDGFSPSASVSKSGSTATITITDKNGTTSATVSDGQPGQDGADGQPGADGYSPSASVSKTGNKSTITITDKNGTTTVEVLDGDSGDVIDDTAGQGDTDKVWSADRTYTTESVMSEVTGNKPILFTHGKYIETNKAVGSVIDLTPQTGSGVSSYAIIDSYPGERITLNGTGGSTGRLYCYIDEDNKVLAVADSGMVATDRTLTAPENTAKIIINIVTETLGNCYREIAIEQIVDDIAKRYGAFGNLVNYEYDRTSNSDAVPSAAASSSTRIGIVRRDTNIKLSGGNVNSTVYIKVSGSTQRTVNSSTVRGWEGITLKTGARYRAILQKFSGTASADVGVSVYEAGTSSTIGTAERIGDRFTRDFTYGSTPVNLVLYIPSGTTFSNAEYELVLVENPVTYETFFDDSSSSADKTWSAKKLTEVDDEYHVNLPVDLMRGIPLTEGKYIYDTSGELNNSSLASASGWIDITGHTSLIYSRCEVTGSSSHWGMVFYNSAKEYISGQTAVKSQSEYGVRAQKIDVPENAVYMRMTVYEFTPFVYDADDYYKKLHVQDVQVNGTSVVTDGVANVPVGSTSNYGALKVGSGFVVSNGIFHIFRSYLEHIKAGTEQFRPIVPENQHMSAFYGMAKAAGDTTQSASSNAVGTYTEAAKSAISQMLNGAVSVSGTTPSITALAGVRYICGEVSTLDITLPASGCIDVTFESGATATVLTITPPAGVTVRWANGFDPTSLDANTTYEINIMDGLGVACAWT